MSEPRPLHLAAFVMATPAHIVHGTWRRPAPGARQRDVNDVEVWVDLARTLERGKFETVFFADIVGLYGAYHGDTRKFVETGLGFPANDPSALAAVLSYATRDIGITFTSSVLQEHPFHFARRISTLDHLTNGRIGWNIVTNVLENAAHNFGYAELTEHDERYRWAEEYVDVAYKLWEGSWDDDALVADRESGLYAHYDKVHKIHHKGQRYQVEGPHLVTPSPQRSPLLFQAGASPAGRAFAARNAEAVFLTSPDPQTAASDTADIRAQAVAHGRRPEDVQFFQGLHVVVGSTEEEAARHAAELDEWIDLDGALAQMGGVAGIDFGGTDLDTPVGDVHIEGLTSLIAWAKQGVHGREATLRDVAKLLVTSNRIVGTPEQIADHFELWRAAGVDGILLMNIEIPGTYTEFVDHVVPVLQARGLSQREYAPGTLRHRLTGRGDRLPSTHPAARYRGAFTPVSA